MTEPLLRIRKLQKRYGQAIALDRIHLDVHAGEFLCFLGPSGSGKTTLLRLIGGQWRPSAGQIHFDGTDVHAIARPQLFELRKRMGMLFQNGALLTDLTVFENVAFPLREHTALPEALIRDLVLLKLNAVGLRGARDLYPEQLSGGMARRVALARAVVLDPQLVMYDEPFTGQDPISMGVLMRLIRSLNDALGLTSIVVSHDVQEVMSIADHVYVIAGGKVLGVGEPDTVRDSQSPWVQQFLRGEPDGPVPFHYKAAPYAEDLLGVAA